MLIAAVVCYLLVCAAATVLNQQRRDASLPYGMAPAFAIAAVPDGSARSDQVQAILDAAKISHINLYLLSPSLSDEGRLSYLWTFLGEPDRQQQAYPQEKYPSFSPNFTYELRSPSDLQYENLAGIYFTDQDTDPGDVTKAAQSLDQDNFDVEMITNTAQPSFLALVRIDPLLTFGLVVGLAVLLLAGAVFTFVTGRTETVLIVNGHRPAQAKSLSYGALLGMYTGAAVVGTGLLIGGLAWYNGLSQASQVLANWWWLALLGFVTAAIGMLFGHFAMRRYSLSQCLQGARPYRLLIALTIVCQIAALCAAYQCVGASTALVSEVQADQQVDQWWRDNAGVVRATLLSTIVAEDWPTIDDLAEEVVSSQTQSGTFILSQPMTMNTDTSGNAQVAYEQPADSPYARFPDGTWLNINARYLDINPLTSQEGTIVPAVAPGRDEAYAIFSANMAKPLMDAYIAALHDWGVAGRSSAFPDVDPETAFIVHPISLAEGENVFTYDPVLPMIRSGVVAIFSPDLMTSQDVSSALSQGAALFLDGDSFRDEAESTGLWRYLSGIVSVSDQGLLQARERQSQLVFGLAALILIVLVLAAASAILAYCHCQADAQRVFVRTVHGNRFVDIHQAFLIEVGCLWAGCLALALLLGWVEPGPGALVSADLGLIFWAGIALALRANSRRIVAQTLRSV